MLSRRRRELEQGSEVILVTCQSGCSELGGHALPTMDKLKNMWTTKKKFAGRGHVLGQVITEHTAIEAQSLLLLVTLHTCLFGQILHLGCMAH